MIIANESPSILRIQDPHDGHITTKKIRNFRRLKAGWHYGEGYSFDENVLHKAIKLHEHALLLGFYETDAFPGIDGSVILTAYNGPECLEFTLTPSGNIQYRLERDDVEVYDEESITLPQAEDILRTFRWERCRPFAFSTSGTMIATENAFVPRHSHVSGMAFLFLMKNASYHLDEPFANTLSSTIPQQQVNPRFFGDSQPIYSQSHTR